MSKNIITNRTTDFDEGFDVEPLDIAMDESGDRPSPSFADAYGEQIEGFADSAELQGDYDDDVDWMERYDDTGYVGWSRTVSLT